AYVFELPQKRLVALPLDQKIQRSQDGKARLDQGQKLLVENQKRRLLQLTLAAELPAARAEQGSRLNPIDKIALLHEPVVNLGFGIAILHLLPQMALFVGDFDQELCHSLSTSEVLFVSRDGCLC